MKFFVTEGLDGSGKSTQVRLLTGYFEDRGIPFKYLHFPRTGSPVFGELIARFLRGELGEINQVHPYLVALIYAGDRKDAADKIRQWLDEGYVVMLDRYVHSNIAFQCAKLNDTDEKKKLRDWINHLEYDYFKIPKPEISLFLDVPFSFTAQKLSQGRDGDDRGYLAGAKDIHEEDLSFQQKVRDVYLWQVQEEADFKLIDCHGENSEMLPPEKIFQKILTALGFI
ncbi:MAG: dTMP kinase [Bacteroidales bacterium]|nr:dTMP kinase [Bacteroidales bacterium]